jgi:hypothetical protein
MAVACPEPAHSTESQRIQERPQELHSSEAGERKIFPPLDGGRGNLAGGQSMGHRIVEAIIEDGQLKYVAGKLPAGRVKVHLIYDIQKEEGQGRAPENVLAETWGIYKDIDPNLEAKNLRAEWERDLR